MQCPRCQHDNPAAVKFCGACGAKLEARCPQCGSGNPPGNKFCHECGATLGTATSKAKPSSPDTYTPKHLAEKILTSKAALEGERKQVTVLFADLKGSMELLAERDPEEARKILDPVLELMMEAVHRYEGTVNQVMGDGIMALFGAPVAHEDHAVRACYAALRMQESVKRHAQEVQRRTGLPIQIRVGLNSGEVVVRSIGSDLHMDYTAVGQTTHLAARMEQLAMAGSIMMTAESLRLVGAYVQVKPLGPVNVKGLAQPVEVYEVTGAGAVRTRLQASAARGLSRFVGRQAEADQLRLALEKAAQGQGQVIAVVGEPGVGKSRLFYEFTRSHLSRGWLILESGGVSYGKGNAFLPLIDLLKGYFRIQDRDDHREIRERVTGKLLTLDRTLEATLPAFLALLEVPVDDAQWLHLDPSQRRQRTLDAVKRLLLRESQVQPLLLLFEDLHWIDPESQAFLDGLIDSLPTARVLLLINYRAEYQHGWGNKIHYRQLRMDPLPPESAEELLRQLLGADPSLAPLRRRLIERAEGNPLFLEESIWALVETHALTGERGAYRLTRPVEAIQIPASVQVILAARIDRLPAPVKDLLQSAAVIGKDVPVVLLEAAAEQGEDQLRRGLSHLQAGEFLYEARLFPEPEYTFKHALTLEVAYQSLLRERRRVLHGRVLEALTRQWAGREGEKIDLFAHHAVGGERWDQAARYLYQSGERAFAQARYHVSAASYQRAIETLDHLGAAADRTLKLDAYLELWSAWTSFGHYEGRRELGEKAEALARALDDGPRLAQVQLRQAQAVYSHGTIAGTLESTIEKAHEAFERAGPRDVRTRSYAQYLVGCACRDLGRLGEAVREFGVGLSLFERVARDGEEPGLVFPIYVSLSSWCAEAHSSLGAFPQAFTWAREALHVATDIQHPTSLAVADGFLGYVHLLHGEPEVAVPLLDRAVSIATEQDLLQATVRVSSHLAHALVLLGERERGLACLARALERWAGAITPHQVGYRTMTASVYLAAGCLEEARADIQRGLAEAIERNARGFLATLVRLEAEALASGDPGRARRRFEEALALATELGMRPEVAHDHFGLGKLYRRTGQHEQAREHLTAATTLYRDMDMRFWLTRAEAAVSERLA